VTPQAVIIPGAFSDAYNGMMAAACPHCGDVGGLTDAGLCQACTDGLMRRYEPRHDRPKRHGTPD
jgi:hypothetical protein